MTTEKNANTSLYIPEELKAKLRVYSAKKGYSITGCIIDAIELFLKMNKD